MQTSFNNLEYIIGDKEIVNQMVNIKPLQVFSNDVIEFLNALSKELMIKGKNFPDVVTFGFWCRKAALLKEKEKYDDLLFRLGRGVVFHSTPSNVPVNFAFSFASGLLSGNANIVRLPAKYFKQVDIICSCIKELLNGDFSTLLPYVCMVKYPSEKEITDFFSLICDTRVIWGGDKTIEGIRKSPLKPRANEITFADRHSIAVINAEKYLKSDNKRKIAEDFYNDTFYSDQNACTSPRVIIWMGQHKKQAKELFWSNIHSLVKEKYNLTPVQTVGKLNATFKVAANHDVKLVKQDDQFITRVVVKNLFSDLMDYKYNSGFFFEYETNNIEEIIDLCDNKCQTLTYFGLTSEEIRDFISYRPCGIDRIVPMGKSMDFTLIWDGYDLIRSLSRRYNIF